MKFAFLTFFLVSMSCHADDWTPAEQVKEAVALSLIAIDYGQTMDIATNPGYRECNTILGDKPDTKKVKEYFLTVTALQVAAANALPHKYREMVIDGTVIVELAVVGRNKSIGLSVKF